MVLILPLVAIGFSFDDLHEAAGLGLIMAAGSAYAWVVSRFWPELMVYSAEVGCLKADPAFSGLDTTRTRPPGR